MKYIVMILTLSSCAKAELREFAPYAREFQAQAKVRRVLASLDGVDISVSNAIKAPILAVCYQTEKRIEVAKYFLDKNGDDTQTLESVLFHELGHCVLGRQHLNDSRDNLPMSLMNKNAVPGSLYWSNREYYLDELFSSSVTQ
jgi:hypothetical protein